ncbi:hypothetical protein V6N13_076054 [Hibiscus sabdariffa]|uniref:Uncharacterized protein n=1 Tax=Hibiscus sabdariffa TaxID=183260 RepID=A0ABR2UDH4_9ROSI
MDYSLLLSVIRHKEKDVGIPECEGAASAKSPWNAPELFDLSILDGESIREWLLFDKSQREFESGKRKQRLTAEFPTDNKRYVKGRAKINANVGVGNPYSTQNAVAPTSGGFDSPGLVGAAVVTVSVPDILGFLHLRAGE